MNIIRLAALVAGATIALSACSSAPPASTAPTPTDPPPSTDPGGGAGQPGNVGSGVVLPPGFPFQVPGGGAAPVEPSPQIVQPKAGLQGVHPVGATRIDALVDGRHVVVRLSWYSGVEPCHVLAGVDVAKSGTTITLTVHEGSADPQAACIELAQYKGVIVDLGELEPGTYTVAAGGGGEAKPITITVA